MKKLLPFFMIIVIVGFIAVQAAEIQRTLDPKQKAIGSAQLVTVNNIVFPAAIYGTDPDPLKQIDEVLEKMHAVLAQRGLGMGNMLQHTIFLKEGSISPMAVLDRFHATARRLAPSLKELRSVGTIIRVPELPDKRAVIMLDMVAGAPLQKGQGQDGYTRIPFKFGPEEIAETIADDKILFTAGTEGMDFEHGTIADNIDDQIVTVVKKLDDGVKKAGLTLSNMVQHNIYMTKGSDPMHVIQKFHGELRKHDPEAKNYLGTGSIMIVDGMAGQGFLLEMDAVLTKHSPKDVKRVPFSEIQMDVVKTAALEDLVFVTAMPGADLAKNMAYAKGIDAQIELAVKNVHNALQKSGLALANIVKHRLLLKKEAADIAHVRAKFYEVVNRLAPQFKKNPSAETFLVLEALEAPDDLFEVSVIAARK
jgi:enamine deaminase RidA (YjgF/YER057c/UK114 family)